MSPKLPNGQNRGKIKIFHYGNTEQGLPPLEKAILGLYGQRSVSSEDIYPDFDPSEPEESEKIDDNSHMSLVKKIINSGVLELLAIGATVAGLVLPLLLWGIDAKNQAVLSKIDAVETKLDARLETISEKIENMSIIMNQRLDDQKDYIDARTDRK